MAPSNEQLGALRESLAPLVGVQFDVLKLPRGILAGFEPSQVGSMVGALMDACIPQLSSIVKPEDRERLAKVGLSRHGGDMKDREAYPDYQHSGGLRAELKLIYVDPKDVVMKRPSTPREPSARLTEKVTVKNVVADKDVILVVAYQLQPDKTDRNLYVPTIVAVEIFAAAACIEARDQRLLSKGGMWFGNYEVPAVLSKVGKSKIKKKKKLNFKEYGSKESEGKDYNKDTNFGKLARIPYRPLQDFLKEWCGDLTTGPETDDSIKGAPVDLDEEIGLATLKADAIVKK